MSETLFLLPFNKSPNKTKDETDESQKQSPAVSPSTFHPSQQVVAFTGWGKNTQSLHTWWLCGCEISAMTQNVMSSHFNSINLMDKPTSRNSRKDFTKNQLGNFNFFGRIQLQQVTQLDTTSMRHLKWSSGHPESAYPKGRVRIPRSLMVNGNMDTTLHFIGWSMHQIWEVQKHNLTSRDFNFNAKKDDHSHHIVPFQPFFLLSCGVFHLSSFFLGLLNCRSLQHLTVRPGFMSLCLCHVMLIVFDLIVSYPFSRCFWVSFGCSSIQTLNLLFAIYPSVSQWQVGHSSMKPPKWWSFWAFAARQPGKSIAWLEIKEPYFIHGKQMETTSS